MRAGFPRNVHLTLHFYFVIQQRPVAPADRLDTSHLKSPPFEAFHRLTEELMSFLFELVRFDGWLSAAEQAPVQPVGLGMRA